MKVCSIVGTRPNFVKLSPMSRELRQKGNDEIIIHTGQHYDELMSDIFFKDIHIPRPDYNLGVKEMTHANQIGNMMIKIEPILIKEKPDVVLVYGDTNSTLAGAIVASKLNLPIAHIEAGCRSYDMTMPEESNRIMIDHISNNLYAPTPLCETILTTESVFGNIECHGDVMVDILAEMVMNLTLTPPCMKYILLTVHRPSNTDVIENLEKILGAANDSGYDVVFPVHPRTSKLLEIYGLKSMFPKIHYVAPMSYSMMIHYIRHAQIIMTDSGGVQKEAYLLRVPCITLRNTTEWVETLEYGWNQLTPTVPTMRKEWILDAITSIKKPTAHIDIFGRVGVCARIVDSLMEMY